MAVQALNYLYDADYFPNTGSDPFGPSSAEIRGQALTLRARGSSHRILPVQAPLAKTTL
jgi:hypothetical protein